MYLYAADRNTLLAFNDDQGGTSAQWLASRIVRFCEPDTYFVKVRAYGASQSGTFTLHLTTPEAGGGSSVGEVVEGMTTTSSVAPVAALGPGDPVEGKIPAGGGEVWHRFFVEVAGAYAIETELGTGNDPPVLAPVPAGGPGSPVVPATTERRLVDLGEGPGAGVHRTAQVVRRGTGVPLLPPGVPGRLALD